MESIITKDTDPSTSLQETRIVCPVCQKQYSQYTCPRCNSRYCSLPCYKKHSIRCTESFMRDNVMEEMQLIQPENKTKQKMLDILKRFHSEEGMDDEQEDFTLSEEIKTRILSRCTVRAEDLPPKLLKQFHRSIACGELSKMLEPWEPWWLKPSAKAIILSRDGTPLVRLVVEQKPQLSAEGTSGSTLGEIPCGPETPLPPVSKLIRAEPSPHLPFHLVDVLYGYCFTLRLYNGDWKCDPLGAAMVALDVSSVMREGSLPETVLEALNNCFEVTCSPMYKHAGGYHFGLSLLNDVLNLCSLGTNALICSLSDLQRIVQEGERTIKNEKFKKAKQMEIRSRLRKADRKLYFLQCWVHEQPSEVWSCTISIIEKEKSLLGEMYQGLQERTPVAKLEQQINMLIKEV